MKTVTKLLIFALSAGLCFTSCKKEEDGFPKKEPRFSRLSPEEHKSNLESAGVTFLQETQGLADATAIQAADNFNTLTGGTLKNGARGLDIIRVLASLNDGRKSDQVKGFLKSQAQLKGEIADAMDSIEGIYTWNASSETFDISSANNEVIIRYPFDSYSSSNDCEISYSITLDNVSGEVTGLTEVPSAITCSFDVKGTEVASYTLTASYDSKGVPSNVKSTLKVDSYKWQVSLSRSSSEISSDFLYAHGSKTLLNYGWKIGGNLNLDDIETYVVGLDSLDAYEEGKITQAGTYIQNVKMYYQVMDIKLVETANTKNLAAAIDAIAADENAGTLTEDELVQDLVSALNGNVNLYLMYEEDFRKIADVEFYVETVTSEEYNYNTYQYEEVTSKEPAVRFIFRDDSKINADVYFENGFEDLQAEMEDMIAEFDSLDSSY